MSELKPCPFCARTTNLHPTYLVNTQEWAVICHDCGSQGGADARWAGAVARWNTRQDAAPVGCGITPLPEAGQ